MPRSTKRQKVLIVLGRCVWPLLGLRASVDDVACVSSAASLDHRGPWAPTRIRRRASIALHRTWRYRAQEHGIKRYVISAVVPVAAGALSVARRFSAGMSSTPARSCRRVDALAVRPYSMRSPSTRASAHPGRSRHARDKAWCSVLQRARHARTGGSIGALENDLILGLAAYEIVVNARVVNRQFVSRLRGALRSLPRLIACSSRSAMTPMGNFRPHHCDPPGSLRYRRVKRGRCARATADARCPVEQHAGEFKVLHEAAPVTLSGMSAARHWCRRSCGAGGWARPRRSRDPAPARAAGPMGDLADTVEAADNTVPIENLSGGISTAAMLRAQQPARLGAGVAHCAAAFVDRAAAGGGLRPQTVSPATTRTQSVPTASNPLTR